MKTRISPEIELIYSQLLWIERRRRRIIEGVGAHFGKIQVERILNSRLLLLSPVSSEPEFSSLVDEREPEAFLRQLAHDVAIAEAKTVTALRKHVSIYQDHVDEQILFGSRTAGQETARMFLSRASHSKILSGSLSIPEAVQALFELHFTGLPGEKNYFLCLRPLGGSTVHYVRSPSLDAWYECQADPKFLFEIRGQWIRGMLDILSPDIEFEAAQAIEQGNSFGLEHFFLRGIHAGL